MTEQLDSVVGTNVVINIHLHGNVFIYTTGILQKAGTIYQIMDTMHLPVSFTITDIKGFNPGNPTTITI